MIQFINTWKRYPGGHDALCGVSFDIKKGEMVYLTGHSGAGKSTLLKLIALIERNSRGQVIVNQHNLSTLKKWQVPYYRRKIGFIFQKYKLLYDKTVFDNVSLPLIIDGTRHQDIKKRTRAALDKVNLLDKERHYPVTLSGGEQQRVGIARAIVNKPPLLLADEPTGNLDPELSGEIMQLFKAFNDVGVTVLIASHDIELINKMDCRVVQLNKGQLA